MTPEIVATIWAVANIVTGLAYLHIPYEVWHWLRRRSLMGMRYVGWLFIAFIVFCGTHHFNMIAEWQHHDKPRLLLTDVPMAIFSVLCSVVLHKYRARLRSIMGKVERLMKEEDRGI